MVRIWKILSDACDESPCPFNTFHWCQYRDESGFGNDHFMTDLFSWHQQLVVHIHNLEIIDTGSGTSIGSIREIMGVDFVIHIAPPMELLIQGVPRSAILDWLDKTVSENKGGPLQIAYHVEPDYDIRNCLAIHDELERRELITNIRLY